MQTTSRDGPVELLLTGGPVFASLACGLVEAVAIAGGRVVACGAASEIEALAGPATRRIDLAGRLALPAFHDCHQHLMSIGLALDGLALRGTTRMADLLGAVRADAAAKRPGEWVVGRGYDHAELDLKRHPTAAELDRAAPDNPVWLVRTCGHLGVANTAALRLAEIGHNTPDPQGGRIERRDGRLTGLLAETAMRLVQTVLPRPDHEAMVRALEAAGRAMNALGIASVMDAAVGPREGLAEIHAYQAARAAGRLPVRTALCLWGDPGGVVEAAWDAGIRPGQGDAFLRFGPVKIFGDGSAGGRTAAMTIPYEGGGPDDTGILCLDDATMHGMLRDYAAQGWQLAIHAIGDAAIEQVLSGMEALGATPDRRHRIEHCGWLTPGQRARMKARGILPVPQPIFLYEFGDLYLDVLGEKRSAACYPMRTWLEGGHHPGASSDAPVSSADPCTNLFTMVTRRTSRGTVIGPDEALTLPQAIHCLTWCGAHSLFEERDKGTLEAGQLADIAVLSGDPFALGVDALERDLRADLTLIGGRVVFDRHGEAHGALAAAG